MTLIVDALARAARQCSLRQPATWVAPTNDEHLEMLDFLEETKDDILDRVDLPSPIGAQVTITGTGAETYTLPSDFRRLQRDQMAVYDVALDRRLEPISNDGEWTYIKDIGTTGIIRYYRLAGYEGNWTIDLYDEPTSNIEIVVSYVSNNWMANGGTVGSAFTNEEDVLLLPRRLVEVGCVWRFRERRGLPYQDKFMEFEALLSRLSNDRRARREIKFGEPETKVRWTDLVPAFIPPS